MPPVPSTLRTILSLIGAFLGVCSPALGARSPQPGIDPNVEPLVAQFACYAIVKGDALTPSFVLEILPGRRYRVPQGEGTFTTEGTPTLSSVNWISGPLASQSSSTSNPNSTRVLFDDNGQRFSSAFTGPDQTTYVRCYQVGPRNDALLRELRARDPQPGTYPCVGPAGPGSNLEVLPGRRYSFGGVDGTYRADLWKYNFSNAESDPTDIEVASGPLAGRIVSFAGDPKSGLRTFTIFEGLSSNTLCTAVVAPTPGPSYGAAKAPRTGRVKNPIVGMYANSQLDVLGYCGNLNCWETYTFTDRGYVFTENPTTGRADAACTKTLPNGLPVCERYAVRGKRIRIGDDSPQKFARGKGFIRIGGRIFKEISPLGTKHQTLRLKGTYQHALAGSSDTITFTPAGRFTRTGVAPEYRAPAPGQPAVSSLTAGTGGLTGRYRLLTGTNTLEFRFDNGIVRRYFVLDLDPKRGLTNPGLIRIGTRDYFRE